MSPSPRKPGPVPARAPGRPKDPRKREAILAAADALLEGGGYERLTMEAVAQAAQVSKTTVYAYFEDQRVLFDAVVRLKGEQLSAHLNSLSAEEFSRDFGEALVRFGIRFLDQLLKPHVISVAHELSAAAARNPELGRAFYDGGPGQMRKLLGGVIADAVTRGTLEVEDCGQAADDLASLWIGDLSHRLAMGVLDPLTPEETEQRVRHGVWVFMRAYAPRA